MENVNQTRSVAIVVGNKIFTIICTYDQFSKLKILYDKFKTTKWRKFISHNTVKKNYIDMWIVLEMAYKAVSNKKLIVRD